MNVYVYIYECVYVYICIYIYITTNKPYDWTLLNKEDIRDKYVIPLRNKFDEL